MNSPFLPGIFLAVISSQRTANVGPMTQLIGPATWYVPIGQGRDYRNHGAPAVVEVAGGLIPTRNEALRHAWAGGLPCCQLDDDLKGIKKVASKGGKAVALECSFAQAIGIMRQRLGASGAKMAGVPPTSNLFYYTGKPVSTRNFVIASWILVDPCGIFFDPEYSLKEDYDYTLQHLQKYGEVCRNNDILPNFLHYSNAGGCKTYRSASKEKAAVELLMSRWGSAVRPHPRRANEVMLRWKPSAPPAA